MPVYERRLGEHVAERISVVPGSDEDERYAALVTAGTGNWLRIDAPKPKRGPGRPKKNT